MKKVTKTILGVSTASLLAVATLTPILVNAWGDNTEHGRPVYTIAQIEDNALGDTITFNSITDGAIGDERQFVGALNSTDVQASNNKWLSDSIEVQDGQTYTLMLYVHNNSPLGEQAIAHNVNAQFSLPTGVGKSLTVEGYLSSSNATPTKYWDEVVFKSNDDFYIDYVDGSAKYVNNVGTFNLPDSIITSQGATLGYTTMNGDIPGCFQYDGRVFIQVQVHKSVTASMQKKVRIKGTKDWQESVDAKVGDEVEYQIEYINLLGTPVDNVVVRDILPKNVEYVNGSTMVFNAMYADGVKITDQDTVATSGLNIGSYDAQSNAFVRFTGKVVDNTLACGSNQLVNWANATVDGAVVAKDDASVMVDKQCDEPEPTPTPEPEPEPTPEPAPSETPTTIVNTGPAEIAAGAVGAGSLVTSLGYYIASRKKLM